MPNYLLTVDVENNTIDGYSFASWDAGYSDMAMVPDMSTLRLVPWLPGSAMVIADITTTTHEPVAISPRSVLKAQVDRLAKLGMEAFVGTELEFIVFDETYRGAWAKGYDNLKASTDYNVDYDLLASTRVEPLLRDMRKSDRRPPESYCEGVKGECRFRSARNRVSLRPRHEHLRQPLDL
jgi:glutamine synthetase